MVIGLLPVNNALAVTGSEIAKDDTYVETVTVEDTEFGDFQPYNVDVSVTVSEGKISSVTADLSGFDKEDDNLKFMNYALDGRGAKRPGIPA